jgi:hypothetical protein
MLLRRERDVLGGMVLGFGMAILYTLLALVIFVATGGAAFEAQGATLGLVILTYFFGGITGGAVFGLLLPWTRRRSGAVLVGILVALPIGAGFGMAMNGPIWTWREDAIAATLFFGLVLGGFGGYSFWTPPPHSSSEAP